MLRKMACFWNKLDAALVARLGNLLLRCARESGPVVVVSNLAYRFRKRHPGMGCSAERKELLPLMVTSSTRT